MGACDKYTLFFRARLNILTCKIHSYRKKECNERLEILCLGEEMMKSITSKGQRQNLSRCVNLDGFLKFFF